MVQVYSRFKTLFIGAIMLSSALAAQHGSTPVNGQNPVTAVQHNTGPAPSPLNGNAQLGPVFDTSLCGLNYVSISSKVTQRVSSFSTAGAPQPQSTPITLPPSPCGASSQLPIVKAFLWAEGSGNGAPITVNITNPFMTPYSFPMTLVGSDQDKCWGYTGSYTYRADITACIVGSGNYQVSGLPVDPPPLQYTNDIDGFTIIVIYQDPSATYTGYINLWDGATTINGGTTTQTINNFSACANGNNARAFCAVGDLQGMACQFTFNGGAPFTVVEDWWNYADMPATITNGQNTYSFNLNSSGDCYNLSMAGIYYQTNCQTCTPASSFTVSSSSTPSQCTANTGTATVTPAGGNGPFTYNWQPGGQTSQTATNLAPGSYTVTVTDAGGCTATDTIVVPGQGNLSFTSVITDVTCFGGNNGQIVVTPNGGGGPYTYAWTPNVGNAATITSLIAGQYVCTVTDAFGCTSTQTLTVTQPNQVALSVTANGSTAICNGNSATMTCSGSGGNGGPYTYTWLPVNQTGTSITVTPATTTTYSVIITDPCNSPVDTATVTITVNPLPTVTISSAPSQSGCAPHCVTLTDNSTPASNNCLWSFGDNTTATTCVATHCYTIPGSYDISLRVTDINGCTNQQLFPGYINVYPVPNASFVVNTPPPITILDSYVAMDDQSNGGDTCIWDFGDGNVLVVPNCGDVFHGYQDTGYYNVRQVVTNQYGCSDTAYSDVFIAPYTTLYVPNTFTPNNDGRNDIFYAYGEFIGQFEMYIFDRWGDLIFKSNDIHVGWDGKANGGAKLAQIDTYVYKIVITEEYTGKTSRILGHVNLIR